MPKRRRKYRRYLKSEHWRSLRAKKLQQRNHECEWCRSKRRLHVHHLRYRNLYDVELHDLAVLCDDCHATVHAPHRKRRRKRARRGIAKKYAVRLNYERSLGSLEREMERPVVRMFREMSLLMPGV